MKKLNILLLVLLANISVTSGNDLKNILILNSYHQVFTWTDNINEGILSVLKPANSDYDITIEYLDFKRHQSDSLYKIYFDLFSQKYHNKKFDVIISSDNAALDFLIKYRYKLFKETPVVFCGVNDYSDALLKSNKNITGVAEVNEVDSTFSLALKLFPKTSDVIVISDTTETSQKVMNQFFPKIEKNYGALKFHYYLNMSEEDLIPAIDSLPSTSIILQVGYFINKNGELESYSTRMKNLSSSVQIPIFGVWDFYLGNGIIGGRLTSSYDQGLSAAQIALQLLSGVNVEQIRVRENIGNSWMFDYKILRKFRINIEQLPKDSRIINEPEAFIKINKNILWSIGILVFSLTIIVVFLTKNIIHRRKVEHELRKARDEAEKAENLKSEFLAQMSHEIRTPVNIILSFSRLIKEDLEKHLTDDLKEGFKSIETGSERLIRTIDLILKMSEVHSGTLEINKVQTDLAIDIIEPVIREFEVLAKKKDLKIEFIPKHSTDDLHIDHYMIKQVFTNLLDNAIKYSEKGRIEITVEKDIHAKTIATIKDEGIGISKEYLAKIFEPFSQEEQGYTRRYEGNGLGLALVKKYCDLNNIDISVESEKAKGAKFTLIFR